MSSATGGGPTKNKEQFDSNIKMNKVEFSEEDFHNIAF
jgi:hypothetical protein